MWYKRTLNNTSNMLHTYSLFNRLGNPVTNYTIYHGIQNGKLTSLVTSYLTSLNRMTLEKIACPLNVDLPLLQHIFIDSFFFVSMLEWKKIFLPCCKIMHGLSFECFVINDLSLLTFVIILLIWTRTVHHSTTKALIMEIYFLNIFSQLNIIDNRQI